MNKQILSKRKQDHQRENRNNANFTKPRSVIMSWDWFASHSSCTTIVKKPMFCNVSRTKTIIIQMYDAVVISETIINIET
jgi:hypothetical protein